MSITWTGVTVDGLVSEASRASSANGCISIHQPQVCPGWRILKGQQLANRNVMAIAKGGLLMLHLMA